MAVVYPFAEEYVAHMRPVRIELRAQAKEIEAKATALMVTHHDTGAAYIDTTKGGLDWFVGLNDKRGYPAAAAIESGHFALDGSFVEGIHVLTRAAYGHI